MKSVIGLLNGNCIIILDCAYINICRSDATGKFPEYPEEDEGGSGLIFKEKDPAELAAELQEKVQFDRQM